MRVPTYSPATATLEIIIEQTTFKSFINLMNKQIMGHNFVPKIKSLNNKMRLKYNNDKSCQYLSKSTPLDIQISNKQSNT